MTRYEMLQSIRSRLKSGEASIGSWMQIPSTSLAEIMGKAGYDWVALDLEHGTFGVNILPDLFRAIELGGTLPLARIAEGNAKECKTALDAGAGGVIIPMIESGEQLRSVVASCKWPPNGTRGVGFSRANLFGKHFKEYAAGEAAAPLTVAMIESYKAVQNLDHILAVEGLDAIFIGPYDLSASMGLIEEFDHPRFKETVEEIGVKAKAAGVSFGHHVVAPSPVALRASIDRGNQFVAYSIDAVFMNHAVQRPSISANAVERTV